MLPPMDASQAAASSRIDSSEIPRLLAEHEDSGISLAAFARQKGIEAYRLYDARRRARKQGGAKAAAFSEVRIVDTRASAAQPIELLLPSGLTVRVHRDFDEVGLRRLLGVLSTC